MALTIPDLLDDAVSEVPDKTWLRYEDSAFTYGAAHARTAGVAGALRERGVDRGDLVLATARNRPEYLFAWLAVVRSGRSSSPSIPVPARRS